MPEAGRRGRATSWLPLHCCLPLSPPTALCNVLYTPALCRSPKAHAVVFTQGVHLGQPLEGVRAARDGLTGRTGEEADAQPSLHLTVSSVPGTQKELRGPQGTEAGSTHQEQGRRGTAALRQEPCFGGCSLPPWATLTQRFS